MYSDPNFKGSADPELVWNSAQKEWWIFYTARRAVCEGCPTSGPPIGVAASKDWIHWQFKGYCSFDGVGGNPISSDTYWAPGVIKDKDEYHMFVTFKKGATGRWGIPTSLILHEKATADDLLSGWKAQQYLPLPFSSIDAAMFKKGNLWYAFFRAINKEPGYNHKTIFVTKSKDLKNWSDPQLLGGDINNPKLTGFNYQEAPYVFSWKGFYWMFTDPSEPGFPVYRSKDLVHWNYQGRIMKEEGEAKTQKWQVRHPSVVVLNNRAFVFYHTEPYRKTKEGPPGRECYLQVSELVYNDGKIDCDRNAKVTPPANLNPSDNFWGKYSNE